MNGAELIVIGGGNMAGAIIEGIADSDAERPGAIAICDVNVDRLAHFRGPRFEGHVTFASSAIHDAFGFAQDSAPVLLGVKPQVFPAVAGEMSSLLGSSRLIISIMAGVSISTMQSALGDGARVVRVMPNLPASLRQGVSAFAPGPGATEEDASLVRDIFSACGDVVELPEDLMDAFTGVAGSGPAYVFYLAEAMIEGAINVGLDPETADRVVRQVIAGASAMLGASDDSAAALRRAVTSPKGTTASAIETLERADVRAAVQRAIEAARDRGRELSD